MITFCDLYSGLGTIGCALSQGVTPLVTRFGCKEGYIEAILQVAGLRPAQACDRLIFRDLDRIMIEYIQGITSPAACLQIAAFIRSWLGHNDRELFDDIRNKAPSYDFFERVAQFIYLQSRSFKGNPVSIIDGHWKTYGFRPEFDSRKGAGFTNPRPKLIDQLESYARLSWPIVDAQEGSAAAFEPIAGSYVYLDHPYDKTTGYHFLSTLESMVSVAKRNDEGGAIVLISEAARLLDMLGSGWSEIDITEARKGPGRNFGATKEYLYINRKPKWMPRVQMKLF